MPERPTRVKHAQRDGALASAEAATDSEIEGLSALGGTEIIFATWHSARIRGIVELPLRADDNALASMVNTGDVRPR